MSPAERLNEYKGRDGGGDKKYIYIKKFVYYALELRRAVREDCVHIYKYTYLCVELSRIEGEDCAKHKGTELALNLKTIKRAAPYQP